MFSLQNLDQALARNEFFLEYMPTIALASGRCVGGEALIRWQNGDHIVYPLNFIPTVENTWLSGRITYWVIETIGKELRAWLKEQDDIHIGINVPPEIVGRGGIYYAAQTAGLLDVADKLMIEVTERGILDELGVAGANVALRRGHNLALDDLTCNDASLLVLARLGAGTVKFDKSFADEMLRPDWSDERIATISALIRNGDLRVIVEGVETARQAEILANAGVQMAQGYYFARPMRAAQFTEYFERVNKGASGRQPKM